MSFPSQVVMSEVPIFMTQGFIINVINKNGYKPIHATVSKDKKGGNKGTCLIQFANEDVAREAVSVLNGKPVSISSSGSSAIPFKLRQCTGNNIPVHCVWVGDLSPEIDDYRFFKFFGDRYKSLCDAKIIVDDKGVSQGCGVLKFSTEDDQRLCVKIMNGSLDLGSRPIKVSIGPEGHPNVGPGPFVNPYTFRIMSGDPWCRYTSWNQFTEPPEYPFIAVKVRLSSLQPEKESRDDRELVKYNNTSNSDYLNFEALERDCHLWDAMECSKWLPGMALMLPPSSEPEIVVAEKKTPSSAKKEKNDRTPSKGTSTDRAKTDEVRKESSRKSSIPSKSSNKPLKRPSRKGLSAASSISKAQYGQRGSVRPVRGVKRSAAQRGGLSSGSRVAPGALKRDESRSDPKSSPNDLMDTLANEIQDSLTKLFTKGKETSPSPKKVPLKKKIGPRTGAATGSSKKELCYKCGDRGHGSPDCPHPVGVKMCYNCQKLGKHTAENCPWPTTRWENVTKALVSPMRRSDTRSESKSKPHCYNCGSSGHWGPECSLAREGKRLCYNCQKLGDHIADDCPEPQRKKEYVSRGNTVSSRTLPRRTVRSESRTVRGSRLTPRGSRGGRSGRY